MCEDAIIIMHIPIHRDKSNVRGLTREVLTALIAIIETQEWKCR